MSKFGFCVFLLALLFSFKPGMAQKADSVKIDTNVINKYRIDPPKNILPIHSRPAIIRHEAIPVTMLDYQVSYWRKYLTIGINVNQSAFSNNWSAGGVSAIALGANFDFRAEYNKQPFSYTTELLMLYGISKNKGQISQKTNDRIFYDNKVASQLSKSWYLFGSFSFESQFDSGYQYADGVAPLLISKFLSPGYLTESFGFEYKPNKYLDMRFGLAALKQTFVLDTSLYRNVAGNYGVDTLHRVNNQLAAQIVTTFNKDIATNVNLQARYALFIPYNSFARITHRVDATLMAKVNRFINVTLNGTLLYDITTNTDKVQASQGLALGVIYKFP